ncbi:MAG: FAD:protein FMN transferase [Kiritimatiellia bacterium]
MKIRPHLPLVLVAALLLVPGCRRKASRETSAFDVMGLPASLEVPAADSPRIDALASILINETDDLRKVLDVSDPDSDLRRMNRLAGSISLPVARPISQILILARRMHEATGGAFDLTLEPYLQIWGFRGGGVPGETPQELLDAAKSVLGMRRIVQRGDVVSFDNEVVSMSVEPVLEGYLADVCALKLRGNLVDNAAVRIGRAVRVLGSKSAERAWEVPVADPRGGAAALGVLRLGGAKDRQAASSCHAFEPCVQGPSGRISWVMDPATGLPASRTLFALVVASTAFEAEALAYALVVRGVEGAPVLLGRFPRCEALILPAEESARVWLTPGMKGIFTMIPGSGAEVQELERVVPEQAPAEGEGRPPPPEAEKAPAAEGVAPAPVAPVAPAVP